VFHAVGRSEKVLGKQLHAKLQALELGALKERTIAAGATEGAIASALEQRDYSTPESDVILGLLCNTLVGRFVMKTGAAIPSSRVWLEDAGEAEGELQVLELALQNYAADQAKKEAGKPPPAPEPEPVIVATPRRLSGDAAPAVSRPRIQSAAMQRMRRGVDAVKANQPETEPSLMPHLNVKSQQETARAYAASAAAHQVASPLLRGNAATLSKTLDLVLQTKQQGRMMILQHLFKEMNDQIKAREAATEAAKQRLEFMRHSQDGRSQRRKAVLSELTAIETELKQRREMSERTTFDLNLKPVARSCDVKVLRKDRLRNANQALAEAKQGNRLNAM
jgi:hypothetical protein